MPQKEIDAEFFALVHKDSGEASGTFAGEQLSVVAFLVGDAVIGEKSDDIPLAVPGRADLTKWGLAQM